jgi:hypothetical protein
MIYRHIASFDVRVPNFECYFFHLLYQLLSNQDLQIQYNNTNTWGSLIIGATCFPTPFVIFFITETSLSHKRQAWLEVEVGLSHVGWAWPEVKIAAVNGWTEEARVEMLGKKTAGEREWGGTRVEDGAGEDRGGARARWCWRV